MKNPSLRHFMMMILILKVREGQSKVRKTENKLNNLQNKTKNGFFLRLHHQHSFVFAMC